jgi:hypothetical protein
MLSRPPSFLHTGQGKGKAGLARGAASSAVLATLICAIDTVTGFIFVSAVVAMFTRATHAVAGFVFDVVIRIAFLSRDHNCVVLRSKLHDQNIDMAIHPFRQVVLDNTGHGGYRGVKIKMGVKILKMAEDT